MTYIAAHSLDILLQLIIVGPKTYFGVHSKPISILSSRALNKQQKKDDKLSLKEYGNRADLVIIFVSAIVFLTIYLPYYIQATTVMHGSNASSATNASNILKAVVSNTERSSTPERIVLALPTLRIFTTVQTTQKLSFGLISLTFKQQIADLFFLLM